MEGFFHQSGLPQGSILVLVELLKLGNALLKVGTFDNASDQRKDVAKTPSLLLANFPAPALSVHPRHLSANGVNRRKPADIGLSLEGRGLTVSFRHRRFLASFDPNIGRFGYESLPVSIVYINIFLKDVCSKDKRIKPRS
jgi:hypothetical protein